MRSRAFTLLEIMVSIVVLAILVIILSRIVTSATTVTTLGNKRMDTDSQVRPVLDRIAVDFAQMIRRSTTVGGVTTSDVDIYAKGLDVQTGNDRIAFFGTVPGYYRSNSSQSPLSLVAYRINADSTSKSYNRLERMGKGLLWTAAPTPSPSPLPSPNTAWMIFGGSPTLQLSWPSATLGDPSNPNYKDPDFELVGPQIFRFEYFYVLTDGTLTDGISPHASISAGFQNVAALVVTIAAIDQKSRVLITDAQLNSMVPTSNPAGPGQLKDADPTQPPSDLPASWQATLDGITNMPRTAIAGIRIYQRYFYFSSAK